MRRQLPAFLFVICLVSGCAPRVSPAFATAIPSVGKIDRFFIVLVTDDASKPGKCNVDVQPKGPIASDPNSVKVKHNWRVAWFVVNKCTEQAGVTPTIEFFLKGTTTKKDPISFTHTDPEFLIGKVKSKTGDCSDTSADAPCAVFKYTIHFGDALEDPDIEIVM
jgi:hypothetical protein